jgi:hypothetical protein
LPGTLLLLASIACASTTGTPSPAANVAPSETPATASLTPGHLRWLGYENPSCGFQILYPPDAALRVLDPLHARIDLAIVPGTNLREKYALIDVQPAIEDCLSPLAEGIDPARLSISDVTIAGTVFARQEGSDAGVGNYWDWAAYSRKVDCGCVSLSFVLHSVQALNYPTPPPLFDPAAESAVFDEILSTFTWGL